MLLFDNYEPIRAHRVSIQNGAITICSSMKKTIIINMSLSLLSLLLIVMLLLLLFVVIVVDCVIIVVDCVIIVVVCCRCC